MSTSKKYIYTWSNLLKINGRLAERLFYYQGCKEISTWSRMGREEK